MATWSMLIDGELRESLSGERFATHNPATGALIAEVPKAAPEDIDLAVAAARRAFDEGPWPRMSARERGRRLEALADLIYAQRNELAEVEVRDMGATIRQAKAVNVGNSVRALRDFAEIALHLPEVEPLPYEPFPAPSMNLLVREPIGVVAAIVPWNFPLQMAVWKLAPALAAGCTIVLKPASWTPLTTLRLGELIAECEIPPGVVNIVTGPGGSVGDYLIQHPLVDKVGFTGSTEVGKGIMQKAAATVKKVTLELGGKSANIILDDADLDIAVDGAAYAIFFNGGQACESGSRLLLPESLHDEFMDRLVKKVEQIVVGDPGASGSHMGPLVSQEHRASVEGYVAQALADGIELVHGGRRPEAPELAEGAYYLPTIFDHVPSASRLAQEEVFGPVLAVMTYGSDEEAVRLANDSRYGLAGAVWSRNTARALGVARQMRTGTVWINDYHLLDAKLPFGGYKESGIGREFGPHGLGEYMELKHVHLDMGLPRKGRRWVDMAIPL